MSEAGTHFAFVGVGSLNRFASQARKEASSSAAKSASVLCQTAISREGPRGSQTKLSAALVRSHRVQ
jgi:hypothetical protein